MTYAQPGQEGSVEISYTLKCEEPDIVDAPRPSLPVSHESPFGLVFLKCSVYTLFRHRLPVFRFNNNYTFSQRVERILRQFIRGCRLYSESECINTRECSVAKGNDFVTAENIASSPLQPVPATANVCMFVVPQSSRSMCLHSINPRNTSLCI
jgi:hypothetical protein